MSEEPIVEYFEMTDIEAVEAACRALNTIIEFETHSDMQMLPQVLQNRIKRIKRNAIIILDDSIKSVKEYYEEPDPTEED